MDESDSIGGLPASSQSQEAGLQPGPGAPGSCPGWPLANLPLEKGALLWTRAWLALQVQGLSWR